MVQFKEVDPSQISNVRDARRGRVSYPILKSFMETGMFVAQLDRTGMQQSFQSLYSSLNAYIRSHELPIKIFSRKNELYLMRLDIDEDGNPIPDWNKSPEDIALEQAGEAVQPITPDVVAARFREEKGQVTK